MVMAVPVAMTMTMSEMTMMTMTMMAVTITMAMTTGESLARDRQRCRGQRQSADSGWNDLLDARHGSLLGVVRSAGIALPCWNPRNDPCGTM